LRSFHQVVLAAAAAKKLPPFPSGEVGEVATFSKARAAMGRLPAVAAACPRTPRPGSFSYGVLSPTACASRTLPKRFLALFGFQQVDRGLDRLADLGPYRRPYLRPAPARARSRRPTRSNKDNQAKAQKQRRMKEGGQAWDLQFGLSA